ncbi:WW domain-binding protein 4 [Chironomus tepperi]|uniref:WW domain-binding protein 4 n=1 Tax=Chironomus tepperi TaxID=113505 RepID=UPI00391EE749
MNIVVQFKFIMSVDFHNNGKRHKANVQQRIHDIGKKSDADRKAQNKLDDDLRKINEAAMKSYSKDISNGTDMTSRSIGHASSSKKPVDPMALPYYEEEDGPNISKNQSTIAAKSQEKAAPPESLWCEAVTDDGDIYYWNIKTNESVWEKPKEGFMTLKEYNKLNEIAIKQQEEARQTDLKYTIENADEIAAKYKREQYKKYQTITQEPKKLTESSSSSSQYADEFGNISSIGEWQIVEEQPSRKAVDLELPKQNDVYYAVANVKTDEPPMKKFKEKTVGSIDSDEIPSVFKKRKIGNRNIRRTNDDS